MHNSFVFAFCVIIWNFTTATIDAQCFLPLKWTHSCSFFCVLALTFTDVFPLSNPDNTAGIRTQRSGFNRHEQNVYFLPIRVVDSGPPPLSSTGTLTIYVCSCDTGEQAEVGVTPLLALASPSPSKAAAAAVATPPAHERSLWLLF